MNKKIDETYRRTIAADWEKSGLSQAEFAKLNGISDRTLRCYLKRYHRVACGEDAIAIVDCALRELTNLRARLLALPEGTLPVDEAIATRGTAVDLTTVQSSITTDDLPVRTLVGTANETTAASPGINQAISPVDAIPTCDGADANNAHAAREPSTVHQALPTGILDDNYRQRRRGFFGALEGLNLGSIET